MKNKSIIIAFVVTIVIALFVVSLEKKSKAVITKTDVPVYGASCTITVPKIINYEVPSDFEPIECDLDEDVQKFLYYMGEAHNIDFHFLMAVIQTESNYQVDKISDTDDYGLMQINKVNHEWLSEELGISDFLDPYQNIIAGTYVLERLFEKHGDASKVLMTYNMGEHGASELWKQGIKETYYTRNIMSVLAEMGDADESETISSADWKDGQAD